MVEKDSFSQLLGSTGKVIHRGKGEAHKYFQVKEFSLY